jgi:photosystem II stability/assembly factor-like uncharacterized protein
MRRKGLLLIVAPILAALAVWLVILAAQRFSDRPEKKISGAFNALEFWADQRAYPRAVMPDAGHYEGYVNSRASLKEAASGDTWRSIGPDNIGGRTLAVTLDPQNPNIIYAGSASGGLWRSRTAGLGPSAWEYVPTGFPVLGVAAIASVPEDSNTIYIGTGEVYGYQNADIGLSIRTTRGSYGIGILKTTDGGQSWTKSLDWTYLQKRGVWAIEINPLNADVVWAGTTEGTYKSTDAGATWTQMDTTLMVMDVIISPADTNTVFIACGNLGSPGGGIYRTADGGQSWTALTQGLPSSFMGKPQLAIYEASPNVILASIGGGYWSGAGTALYRSLDNGDTWSTLSTVDYATYQGWYSHLVGVHPADSSQVICAGIELYKSTAGGRNLVQKSQSINVHGVPPAGGPEGPPDYIHVDIHSITYHPTDPDLIYFGTDGGVFRSTDGGETFEGCNGGYQTTQFYNGFSSAATDSNLAIGGLQDNYTTIYEGSPSWRRVLYGDGAWTSIHPFNPDIMYGSYQYLGTLYRSTDGGDDWTAYRLNFMGDVNFIGPYIFCPGNPDIGYAGTSYMYRTINGGTYWYMLNEVQELDGNPVLSLAVSAYNSDLVFAGTAPVNTRAHLFRTADGGNSWIDVTGDLPDRYPVDIAVDPTYDANVYVVFSGFGTSHVWKTADWGDHWQDVGQSLPDVPTSAVAVDPLFPDHIYVGNDLGVYVSMDRGHSWAAFRDGLPDAVIAMDLSISPVNRTLRVATHGNGVYERPLLGPTGVQRHEAEVPASFQLLQNYPNPFNAATTIEYFISEPAEVHLAVYNVTGQLVGTLVDEWREAGRHTARWETGEIASGVYFYKLTAAGQTSLKKCVVVR